MPDEFDVVGTIRIQDDGSVVLEKVNKLLGDTEGKTADAGKGFLDLGNIADFAIGELAVKALEKLKDLAGEAFEKVIGEASEMQDLQTRMNARLTSTGEAAGMTAQSLTALAESNRDLAGGQDHVVLSAENVLLKFQNINASMYPQAVKLTLDLAAAMGMNASSAAEQLGRALNEPGFAGSRLFMMLGQQLLPTQKKAIEQMTLMGDSAGAAKIVMDALTQAVGGQAAAQASTFSGKMQILSGHMTEMAESLGMHLLPLLDKLATVFGPVLETVLTSLSANFDAIADQAVAWGGAIIDNLAAGMQAAAATVVAVINEIGSIISGWMAPGSPPKFLPDLAVWGQQTATTYMEAWSKADFSTFNDLSKTIEGYLKSISGPKADISDTLLGDKSAISQMISEMEKMGRVSAQTFDTLWAKTGITDTSIKQYTRDMLDLAAANKAVDTAQQALTDVTDEYDAQLTPLKEKLQAAQNTQADVKDDARIAELQQIIANPADEQTKKAAMAELDQLQTQEQIRGLELQKTKAVDAATAKLNAATKERDNLQKTVELEKARLGIIQDNTNLVNGQEGAVNKLAAAAKGAAAALGALGAAGAALKAIDTSTLFKTPTIDTKGLATATKAIQDAFAPATKAVQDLQYALGMLGSWINTEIVPQLEGLQKALDPDIHSALKQLDAFWTGHFQPTLNIFWNFLATSLIPTLAMVTTILFTFWIQGIKMLAHAFVNVLLPVLIGYWEFLTDKLIPRLVDLWTYLQVSIPGAIDTVAKVIQGLVDGAIKSFHDALHGISQVFSTVVGAIKEFGQALANMPQLPGWLTPGSPTPFENGLRGIASALGGVNKGMGGLGGQVGGMPTGQPVTNTTNNTYNFSQHISASTPARLGDFAMLRAATRGL